MTQDEAIDDLIRIIIGGSVLVLLCSALIVAICQKSEHTSGIVISISALGVAAITRR